jgi:MoxR-like ATPase
MQTDMSRNKMAATVIKEVANAIVGKNDVIVSVFFFFFSRGHILIDVIPGVGKTTLAIAFSKALNLAYSRVQFTPDVLPSDITGFSIFDKESGNMIYTPGAVMCNIFLADELNRATSRTQSALLEAMEEGQVTVDGVSRAIEEPFIVIATQNPVGAAGTQLLPDSQMDRFMVRLSLGYPAHDDELSLIERKKGKNLLDLVNPVLESAQIEQMRSEVDKIHIHHDILNYIVKIVGQTRIHPDLLLGASPRASVAIAAMAKAMAYTLGRDFVIPDDIPPILKQTLSHRLLLRQGAESENITSEKIIDRILRSLTVPRIS